MAKFRDIVLIVTIFAGVFPADQAFAQGAGQAGEFLRFGVNARALAMGRAFTAVADNASAVYWNPGGLIESIRQGISLSLMQSQVFDDTRFQYVGLAVPIELFISPESEAAGARELRRWNVGVGYVGLSSDGYEVRDAENRPTGQTFSDVQSAFYVAISRAFAFGNHRLGVGVNVKFIKHSLFGFSGGASSVDVGFKYLPSVDWLELGATIRNVNKPDLGFSGRGSDPVPVSARLGGKIQPRTGWPLMDAALLAFDVGKVLQSKRAAEWFLGIEYDLTKISQLPFQIQMGANSRKDFTFGVSIDLPSNKHFFGNPQWLPRINWALTAPGEDVLGRNGRQFSLDFSYTPFTSFAWYERGLQKLKEGRLLLARQDFARASMAKDPNDSGYPLLATLRMGDLEIVLNEDKKLGLSKAFPYYERVFSIVRKDLLKQKEFERNARSFLYYLQALYSRGRHARVIAETERYFALFDTTEYGDEFRFIRTLSLISAGKMGEAQDESSSLRPGYGSFALGLIAAVRSEYEELKSLFVDLNNPSEVPVPEDLFGLPFGDFNLGDDILFLRAYGMWKRGVLQDNDSLLTEAIVQFAEIQRFYPVSDLLGDLDFSRQFELLLQGNRSEKDRIVESWFLKYLQKIKREDL